MILKKPIKVMEYYQSPVRGGRKLEAAGRKNGQDIFRQW